MRPPLVLRQFAGLLSALLVTVSAFLPPPVIVGRSFTGGGGGKALCRNAERHSVETVRPQLVRCCGVRGWHGWYPDTVRKLGATSCYGYLPDDYDKWITDTQSQRAVVFFFAMTYSKLCRLVKALVVFSWIPLALALCFLHLACDSNVWHTPNPDDKGRFLFWEDRLVSWRCIVHVRSLSHQQMVTSRFCAKTCLPVSFIWKS